MSIYGQTDHDLRRELHDPLPPSPRRSRHEPVDRPQRAPNIPEQRRQNAWSNEPSRDVVLLANYQDGHFQRENAYRDNDDQDNPFRPRHGFDHTEGPRIMKLLSVLLMALLLAGGARAANTPVYPGLRVVFSLDVSIVTTGGTAVTAIAQGHRIAGGWLFNPAEATVNLCINERGTASGTTSQGDLACIVPGQTYLVTPGAGPVSVVTSDSAHPFSGAGWAQ